VDTILENASEVRPTLLFSVPRIFNKIYDKVQKQIRQGSFVKKKLFDWAMSNSTKIREARTEDREAGWLTKKLDGAFDGIIFEQIRDKLGGRLRYAFSGGAALSPEVAKFIDNLHITVYEGYGLTETSPVAAVNRPEHRKIGSVGLPIPGTELLIQDLDGYEEGIGEVCIRGPNIMQGYHNLSDKTDEVLDEDGTFHSGDLGRIDDDGFLWILGRVKEQYKLENGRYVAPAPVEEQLKLSPYINQVMIEGTGCPYNVALIVVDEESLQEWAEERDIPVDDDLLGRDEVRELYHEQLQEWGAEIKSYERPKDFYLVTDEFTPENDMLTPTLKLKRRNVMKAYGDRLAELYDQAVPLSQKAAE
jgi:long-chain acyl-CoA synthetase